MSAADDYTFGVAGTYYRMCEEIDRLRSELDYMKKLAGGVLRAQYGDARVNDLLPRAGMPEHALDELAVDAANQRRRRTRWNLP